MARADDLFGREGPLKAFLFVTCETGDDNEATMEYLDGLTAVVRAARGPGFSALLDPVGDGDRAVISSPGLGEGLEAYFRDHIGA